MGGGVFDCWNGTCVGAAVSGDESIDDESMNRRIRWQNMPNDTMPTNMPINTMGHILIFFLTVEVNTLS